MSTGSKSLGLVSVLAAVLAFWAVHWLAEMVALGVTCGALVWLIQHHYRGRISGLKKDVNELSRRLEIEAAAHESTRRLLESRGINRDDAAMTRRSNIIDILKKHR
jgi:hypothetical protein